MSIWSNINYEPVPKRVKALLTFGSYLHRSTPVISIIVDRLEIIHSLIGSTESEFRR